MFLRAACLVVALTLVSSQDVEDIELKALKPGSGSYTGETLSVKCSFDRSQTDLDSVTKLELFATHVGEENFELVASVVGDSVSYGMSESDLTGEGKISAEATKKSKLQVTWTSADNGYCKFYKCVVTGLNSGAEATYEAYKEVKAKAGDSGCSAQRSEEMLGDLGAQVEECKAAIPQTKMALSRLQAINGSEYHLSSIYNGRVYLVHKKIAPLNLHANNEACKVLGGYLVEFEDQAEQDFVGKFVKTIGRAWYFTGANDRASEGNFVYFNSKKPMPDMKWRPGNPDQWGGNEDCVDVNAFGINDIGCRAPGRYICEIPLM